MNSESNRPDDSTIPLTDAIVEAPQRIQRGSRHTRSVLIAGAVVMAGGLGVWAYSDYSKEATSVEVADDETDSERAAQSEESAAAEEDDLGMAMEMGEAMMGEEGPGGVVFHDGRFVALGYGPTGQTIRTSEDGLAWSDSTIVGLPRSSHIFQLVAHDGTYAALVEQWNEDGGSELFGHSEGPNISIAHTTDLENWTLTAIPQSDAEDVHTGVSHLGLTDDGVVVVTQDYPNGPDEMRLLYEAGVLDEAGFDRYCGLRISDSDVIEVLECSHDSYEEPDEDLSLELENRWNAATTDEERAAIEVELEDLWGGHDGEVVAEIPPGSDLHSELSRIYNGEHEADFSPTTTLQAGPLGGDLTAIDLPVNGYVNAMVRAGQQLHLMIMGEDGATQVFSSPNGTNWVEAAAPAGQLFEGTFHSSGDSLLFAGYEGEAGQRLHVSTDGGTNWSVSTVPTSLYGAYPMIVSGPAGYVTVVSGTSEPYESRGPESMEVTKDGYTLSTLWEGNGETATLTGPDGTVIFELKMEEIYGEGGPHVRTNPFSGMPTFLDPDTGAELVSFTEEDYERSYQAMEELEFGGAELTHVSEYYFSTDGVSWSTIDDDRLEVDSMAGNISAVAVGDDEAIFVKHTWSEPPAELFAFEEEGREPTDQEINALESWEMTAEQGGVEYIRVELGS